MEEDKITIRLEGGITLQNLMDGGDHNDEVHRHVRRTDQRRQQNGGQLPRELLCAQVTEKGLERPIEPPEQPQTHR